MGTKTIGLDDEAYAQLKAEKRDDESFSETVKRVTAEVASDWHRGFGKYADDKRFEEVMSEVRRDHATGRADRQDEVLEAMGIDTSDHYTDSTSDSGGEDEVEDTGDIDESR